MGRSSTIYILLSLLGPAAGCQLISHENLTAKPATADNGLGAPNQAALPPLRNCTSSKDTAEVCLATAEALAKAGKEADAIALYEKARQNGANKQQVARRLAFLYDQQKDFKRALEEYKELLQRNPKDADLLNDVGYCYYNQGNWSEAEKYLRQALTINASNPRAWTNLGMTLAQANRAADSLEAFAKVVSPAQALCNLAFILQTQSKFEEAKAAYRQALDQEPNLNLARACLAKLEKTATPSAPIPPRELAPRIDETYRERIEAHRPVEVPLP
ncbi:MAG TPA: tetratricopeptide repeat protein [Gemmataceae bacterium]|jgi:tetratricopeptide (TPR) repeat protein|nr:tetratricopeptide repeat protein [Gemmataceae bacterium]